MKPFKKKVKEKIKQYSNEEYLDGYINDEFLTDDGKADIFLNINSLDELYDYKTAYAQTDLHEKVYKHIDAKASMLNNDIPLKLRIIGMKFDNKEQEQIKHIITEHYAIELYKIQKRYRRHRTKAINLLLLGIVFSMIYAIVALTIETVFIKEVLGFLFSFTLWEAFDEVLFTRGELKYYREVITQKLLMEVVFEDVEQEDYELDKEKEVK